MKNKMRSQIFSLNVQMYRMYKKIIVLNFLVWFMIACLPLLISYLIKTIFDNLQLGATMHFYQCCILAGIVVLIHSVFIVIGGKVDTITRFNIRKWISKKLILRNVLTRKHRENSSEALVEILSNDILAFEELISTEIDLICKILFAVIAFMILLNISYQITIFVMLPVIVINRLIIKLRDSIQKKHISQRKSDIRYADYVSDVVKNHEAIQYHSIQDHILKESREILNKRKGSNIQNSCFEEIISQISDSEGVFSISFVLLFLCAFSKYISLSTGDFALIISLSSYLGQYNGLFKENIECMQHLVNTNTLIADYFEKNILQKEEENNQNNEMHFKDKICINIDLGNGLVDLEIKKGDFVVITGSTGSGKSHFIDALLGYAVYKGDICVDGKKVEYLENVAVSLQEPAFINENIKDNLTFGRDEVISEGLKFVNLFDEMNLYLKNDSSIGVNGKKLSSGQRQRLSIARVLQTNSSIFVFDDSTQLLDVNNEKEILKKIKKCKATVIFVSNKENVIEQADLILDMDNRKVIRP